MPGPRGRRGPMLVLLLVQLLIGLSGCYGYKPSLHPNVSELVINEGDSLEITCSSIRDIIIFYPEDDEDVKRYTSAHFITPEDQSSNSVKIKFRRPVTVFGDTGWYGCADSKAQITSRNYDNPDSSWIYVYVKSNLSAFVDSASLRTIVGTIGDSVTLPCLPTSPDLHVKIRHNHGELKLDEKLTFNPKIGFTLKWLTAKDSGIFSCEINENGLSSEMLIIIKPVRKGLLKTPTILEDGLQHVTAGSRLNVKCSVEIGSDNKCIFFWTTPRNSSSRTVLSPVREIINRSTYLYTSELIEENVTYDDEGEYICTVKSLVETKSVRVYIQVYDPNIKYINLTSQDENRHYVINVFNPVMFSANVDAFPTPTLTWLNSNGQEIILDNRFSVENIKTTSTLKIKSVQIEDTGTYTLQANNDDQIERLNFTLEVLAKPWAILDPNYIKPYYSLGENATFVCRVVGNPISTISWFYIKCPKLPSMDDCETLKLEDIKKVGERAIEIDVATTAIIEMSGKINCTACNTIGCDSVEQDILVSDGVTEAALGIREPEGQLTVGDNITVPCTASVYNFSSVMWYYNKDERITDSDRIKVIYEQTQFTYRAVLTIINLQQSDKMVYHCIAKTWDNETNEVQYDLILADPEKPYFISGNMNGTKITISESESHNTIYLLCYVGGMPKPVVMWYKDDKPLKLNKQQFSLVSDNQELIIKYLLEKDSGKYSCVVKNRFGEISQFQKFIVKGVRISRVWIAAISSVILILSALLVYFCIKVRREKMMRKQLLEAGLMYFEEGALDCISSELTVDDQADLLPYDRKWEFPRNKLKLGKQLGSGAFGVVMKAEAQGIRPDESVTTVAVKMVRKNAEPAYIRALASELKIMVHLGKHLNVVNLLGACTNNIAKCELLVIVEYCRFGNLHNYLLRHRENFIDQIDPSTGKIDPSIEKEYLTSSTSASSSKRVKYAALSFSRSLNASSNNITTEPGTETVIYRADSQELFNTPELNSNGSQPGWRSNYRGDYKDRNIKPICTQDLLSWAFQVARGMEYLCQRKVLHGDLAARNILLAENNVVKICDFGLAKTMYKDENYQKQGNGPVPIKWMAIESIRDRVFSTQSDIWSFGIVLWEFFTLAKTPYPGMQAEKQYQRLVEGYRMEQPKYATKDIYDIMLSCWKAKPTLRPSFSKLVDSIGAFLEEGVKMHYVDLNSPYLDMNMAGLKGKDDYLSMMSSPDHEALVSPLDGYVNNSPQATDSAYLSTNSGSLTTDTRIIFSPRPASSQDTQFQFSDQSLPTFADPAHSDGEDAPMLQKVRTEAEEEDDDYLKPIDVRKKREEFMKQREAEKRKERERSARLSSDRDSGYCNTPKNLELIDLRGNEVSSNGHQNWLGVNDKPTVILKTQDNYVNIPQQINKKCKDVPDSFMNPSYIFIGSAKSD